MGDDEKKPGPAKTKLGVPPPTPPGAKKPEPPAKTKLGMPPPDVKRPAPPPPKTPIGGTGAPAVPRVPSKSERNTPVPAKPTTKKEDVKPDVVPPHALGGPAPLPPPENPLADGPEVEKAEAGPGEPPVAKSDSGALLGVGPKKVLPPDEAVEAAPARDRVASEPFLLPTASPINKNMLMIGGGVLAFVLLTTIIGVATCGGDEDVVADADAESSETEAEPGDEGDEGGEEAAGDEEPELPLVETDPEAAEEFETVRGEAREHFGAGRFAEAAEKYRRATELDYTHAGSFAGLGAALSQAGDLPGAIAAYESAVALRPSHSGFHAALGRVLRDSGDLERAVEEYRRAYDIDPDNRAAKQVLEELDQL